jgi:NTE family protein
LEAGIVPDLLVGTSIGAVNAAGLALWDVDLNGVDILEKTWQEVSGAQILDPRISQLIVRAMVGRPSNRGRKNLEDFFVSHGFSHTLTFNQISWVRLAVVAADIEAGETVIYGQDPGQSILEGLMASVSIPPWFAPYHKNDQILIDGGALSNLPIEPAMRMGATEIFALDLDDNPEPITDDLSITQYFQKYIYAVSRRHVALESELAEERGVLVHCVDFRGLSSAPMWDFSNHKTLIQAGYERTCQKIAEWRRAAQPEHLIPVPSQEKQMA